MAATGRATGRSTARTRSTFRQTSALFGLPEGVAQAIAAALATADRYPDPLCRALRAKLCASETVPADQILCGNGAADLIFRLVSRKSRAAHYCPRRLLQNTRPHSKPSAVTSNISF